MGIKPGLSELKDLNVEALIPEATAAGFRVFALSGGIASREAFFDAVRETIPLDPPIVSSRSWDALSDSLFGGLVSVDQDRILIIWPNANTMAASSPIDYETAVHVLTDVVSSLADRESTQGNQKRVSVILG
jgi:hypothetical protein